MAFYDRSGLNRLVHTFDLVFYIIHLVLIDKSGSDGSRKREQMTMGDDEIRFIAVCDGVGLFVQVKFNVVLDYCKAVGPVLLCTAVLFCLFLALMQVGANIWLREWTDDPVYENASEARAHTNLRLGVYGAFGIGQRKLLNRTFTKSLISQNSLVY